jgi:hypothetical protein
MVSTSDKRGTVIDLGKTEALMLTTDQIPGEELKIGERVKAYITKVEKNLKGPQVFVSRTHAGLVKRLFELEVPEIYEGIIEIISVAREAGSRTKMAVMAKMETIKSTLDLTDAELRKFVVGNPQVVLLDCSANGKNTTIAKIAKSRSVLSMDEILDNPMIMNVPAQKFIIRYMIAKNAGARDAFVNGGFMYNEKKVYARAQYLASLTGTQYASSEIFSDKFEKKYGVLDATLTAQYPLDAAAISNIEATYAANNRRPITLKPEERNAVL